MNHYAKHIFICVNQRDNGKQCCQDAGAADICAHLKTRVKALGLSGKNNIRVSSAGCMGRCAQGPTLVIYPEGIWYTYKNIEDIEEILTNHLQHGQQVERLLL